MALVADDKKDKDKNGGGDVPLVDFLDAAMDEFDAELGQSPPDTRTPTHTPTRLSFLTCSSESYALFMDEAGGIINARAMKCVLSCVL